MNTEHTELSAYLDGELDAKERQRVEARLGTDPAYAEELQQLERAKTMLALAMQSTNCTLSVRERLVRKERKIQSTQRPVRFLALATTGAIVLVSIGLLFFLELPQKPLNHLAASQNLLPEGGEAKAPVILAENTDEESLSSAIDQAPLSVTASEIAPEAPPVVLMGTITGKAPSAAIEVPWRGKRKVRVFSPGEELVPGMILRSVASRKVTVDYQGEQLELQVGKGVRKNPFESYLGSWELYATERGKDEELVDLLKVSLAEQRLQVDLSSMAKPVFFAPVLEGSNLHLYGDPGSGVPVEILISLNKQAQAGEVLMLRDEKGLEVGDLSEYLNFRIKRPNKPLVTERADLQETLARLKLEVGRMKIAISNYAKKHEGQAPPSKSALETWALEEDLGENFFSDTENRTLHYDPRQNQDRRFSSPLPKGPSLYPPETFPQRALAHEAQLRKGALKNYIFAPPLLSVAYEEPAIALSFRAGGEISMSFTAAFHAQEAQSQALLAQSRASDQNNLKQLGLVIKMFMNEHEEYTPAGWLSVFPEYLTDRNILTSPIDPLGTDSYEYLLPATHIPTVVEAHLEEDTPAGEAISLSRIPLVLNKNTWPNPKGKNILFADGHVEFRRIEDISEILNRVR